MGHDAELFLGGPELLAVGDRLALAGPTSQYVRLFCGLCRSTSREYLVFLADDQMPDTAPPSWRGPFPTRRSTFQAPQNGRREVLTAIRGASSFVIIVMRRPGST